MNRASFGLTDVGRRRESNEDAFLEDEQLGLYVVADGMGGHAAGEVASRIAVETLLETMAAHDRTDNGRANADRIQVALRTGIEDANRRIHDSVESREDWRGMGTTLVAMAAAGPEAVIGYVGDSRAYLLRNGSLRRLTSDHSWVNEQVKMGLLTDEDAQRHPMRNIVTRALGNRNDVEVDVLQMPMHAGDIYLLCSDGLNTMLEDDEIQGTLERHAGDPRAACEALVDLANERGGEDNTTVIVVEIRA
jgi:protein phosphatase